MPREKQKPKSWYEIRNAAEAEAEILIYDDIGFFGVGAEQFVSDLKTVTAPTIHVRVNSYGGEVFDGFAIFNALDRHDADIIVHVDGVAASAASYIVMAGDEIRMAKNAFLMIHNPQGIVLGDSGDMRVVADLLDKLRDSIATMYADRTQRPMSQIVDWMNAETWFNAKDASENGLADAIEEANKAAPESPPENLAQRFWNSATKRQTPSPSTRLAALGLDELLEPTNQEQEIDMPITVDQFKDFAASNVDAVKQLEAVQQIAADEFARGKSEAENTAKPKPATATELKAAFPDDTAFVMDRLDHDGPMSEHKIAYADHLKAKLTAAQQDNDTLRAKIAEIDPASAGQTTPANTAIDDTEPKPMTPQRRNELRSQAGLPALN